MSSAMTANTMTTPRNIALTLPDTSTIEVTILLLTMANQVNHLSKALSVKETI